MGESLDDRGKRFVEYDFDSIGVDDFNFLDCREQGRTLQFVGGVNNPFPLLSWSRLTGWFYKPAFKVLIMGRLKNSLLKQLENPLLADHYWQTQDQQTEPVLPDSNDWPITRSDSTLTTNWNRSKTNENPPF